MLNCHWFLVKAGGHWQPNISAGPPAPQCDRQRGSSNQRGRGWEMVVAGEGESGLKEVGCGNEIQGRHGPGLHAQQGRGAKVTWRSHKLALPAQEVKGGTRKHGFLKTLSPRSPLHELDPWTLTCKGALFSTASDRICNYASLPV